MAIETHAVDRGTQPDTTGTVVDADKPSLCDQGRRAMNRKGPGFAVLYRWRLRPGSEDSFVEGWSRVSLLLRDQRGSLGSRLHRGADGLWYGYAQWPSAEARAKAFALGSVDPAASRQMRDAILETLPEVQLESIADFIVELEER